MRIDLACNDHRNGMFQGYVETARIEFGKDYDDGLDVEGPRVKVCELDAVWLKLGRVRVFVHHAREWSGNWCWNAYDLDVFDMRAITNYLRRRGWRCHCGPTELYERFNADGEITLKEWTAMLAAGVAP